MQEFVKVSVVLKYILVVMLSKLCAFFFFLSVLSVFSSFVSFFQENNIVMTLRLKELAVPQSKAY